MKTRHVILDRDGVLNEEGPRAITRPDEWRWIQGSVEGLALLTGAGVRLSLATNQAGIGRGLLSWESLSAIHEHMLREARAEGATIEGIFVCPHCPEQACECRKPAPGLIKAAILASGIPASETVLVGDDARDLLAATAAGVRGALVLTGKGSATARLPDFREIRVYPDLRAVARAIVGERPCEATR